MVRVTGALLVVTVLPAASYTVTTGWVPKAVPPVELDGLVVKASLVADPAVMLKLVLTALVSPVAAVGMDVRLHGAALDNRS
jgi:hypothetical protein